MASLFTGASAPDLTKVEGYPLPINKGGTGVSSFDVESSSWNDDSLIVGKNNQKEAFYIRTVKNLKDYILKDVTPVSIVAQEPASPVAGTLYLVVQDNTITKVVYKQ